MAPPYPCNHRKRRGLVIVLGLQLLFLTVCDRSLLLYTYTVQTRVHYKNIEVHTYTNVCKIRPRQSNPYNIWIRVRGYNQVCEYINNGFINDFRRILNCFSFLAHMSTSLDTILIAFTLMKSYNNEQIVLNASFFID